MSLFAKVDANTKLQRDLESRLKAKVDQRADNAARRRSAEAKLVEAKTAVEATALETDDKALDAALAARRVIEDKLAALTAAASRIDAEIAGIEAEIAKLIDGRTRGETSAAISALIEQWTSDEAAFVAAAEALENTSREISLVCLDAHGTTSFLMSARTELPPAGVVITTTLRQYAEAVVNGHAPARMPQATPEPVPLKIVKPDTMIVFLRRAAKYINKDGKTVLLRRYTDQELPSVIGRRALQSKTAMELSHPERKRLFGQSSPLLPSESSADDLGREVDSVPAAPAPKTGGGPAILHSAFEEPVIGPAIIGTMSRPPEPMAMGARKLDAEES